MAIIYKNTGNKINLIFFILFSFVVSFLSYFIPKKKGFYIFGSSAGDSFSGNPKYLFLKRAKSDSLFLSKSQNIIEKLKKKKLNCLDISEDLLTNILVLLRADKIFIDSSIRAVSPFVFLLGNFDFVQTWHGTPLKKIDIKYQKHFSIIERIGARVFAWLSFSSIKYMICADRRTQKIFTNVFKVKNIYLTGYPRNDVLFNKKLIFNNYKKLFYLRKYRKIFLYAPTFRDDTSALGLSNTKFLDRLNNYLKKVNAILLVKTHDFQSSTIARNLSNIIDVTNTVDDVQELLIYIDVLITDYSSVMFDFTLTDKPIIFYSYDHQMYLKNCREMYYDYYSELPGPFAKNENELLVLIKTVEQVVTNQQYQKKYKQFKEKFNKYQDGDSCMRIFELLQKE